MRSKVLQGVRGAQPGFRESLLLAFSKSFDRAGADLRVLGFQAFEITFRRYLQGVNPKPETLSKKP